MRFNTDPDRLLEVSESIIGACGCCSRAEGEEYSGVLGRDRRLLQRPLQVLGGANSISGCESPSCRLAEHVDHPGLAGWPSAHQMRAHLLCRRSAALQVLRRRAVQLLTLRV